MLVNQFGRSISFRNQQLLILHKLNTLPSQDILHSTIIQEYTLETLIRIQFKYGQSSHIHRQQKANVIFQFCYVILGGVVGD